MESIVKRWRCDVCGNWLIASEGYVLWDYDMHRRTGFQIVHRGRNGCDDHSRTASSALVDFLGPDGFARATALMAVGPIMRNSSPGAEFGVIVLSVQIDTFSAKSPLQINDLRDGPLSSRVPFVQIDTVRVTPQQPHLCGVARDLSEISQT